MIYSIDGNIVSIDDNFFERIVNQLTFQIKGGWFPQSSANLGNNTNIINENERFVIDSIGENTVTVNYGDGNSATIPFANRGGSSYSFGYSFVPAEIAQGWVTPQHTYSDGFTGIRNISFEFEFPERISGIQVVRVELRGSLPGETESFVNINLLKFQDIRFVTTIPDSFPLNLQTYSLTTISQLKHTTLPRSLFESKLVELSISGSYNLSDRISSNLFMINQLKGTLKNFFAENCNITQLPSSIAECVVLEDLRLGTNDFNSVPNFFDNFSVLKRLYLSSSDASVTEIPYWEGLVNLESLFFGFPYVNVAQIETSWSKLYSLKEIIVFNLFITSNSRFNQFIDAFYTLCTTHGSIIAGGSPAPYTNRFRNISWGHGSLSFTGAKVAPAGFVSGVSNGTPANQGEKVYVLQNQYNHTITHA